MGNIVLNIAKDYSRCPGARYESEGDFSGERFRKEFLAPMLKKSIETGVKLEVVLDGSNSRGFGQHYNYLGRGSLICRGYK